MVLPHQRRFRIALSLARLARPATPLIDRIAFLKPIAAMLALAPQKVPQKPSDAPSPATEKRGRVAILQGCAEPVLRPDFREATVRLLTRCGLDVTFAEGEVCCGALVPTMGREDECIPQGDPPA